MIVICLCLTPVIVVLGLKAFQDREPRYAGKSLSAWLVELSNPDPAMEKQARTAVHEMGTNAIPKLLKLMSAEDSSFKLQLIGWTDRQSWVRFNFPLASNERAMAAEGFAVLGPEARSAVPALSRLAQRDKDGFVGQALVHIGTEGVGALAQALANNNFEIKSKAIDGLIRYGVFYDLEHSNVSPQELATFSIHAQVATVPLLKVLQETNRLIRSKAILALGWLRFEPRLVVPALITNLQSTTSGWMVQASSITALGQFKSDAREAIPLLTNALSSPDPIVRARANTALIQIDLETASKLGIKESEDPK
ncbi:HEAT repeat domain-containing protein [Pedosphaera parvula]|uniref:PBS lyase HEAT domain protein repeat-containing protein n=1 Tax=Pedosphaera parvula (strain Ellin514) TaxID=320771 RepID=B9XRH4_PEDPL|nr:HEAT repeat domain-containing protein [Pedosphaera parvula]EEF57545.1 PBS lyase HEAT domain protein repeat-containing protein [Pedosphaera parvula Ellin514]